MRAYQLCSYLPQYDWPGRRTTFGCYSYRTLVLNCVATGFRVSNHSPRRSIEKMVGSEYEGRGRESGLNDSGEFEDELLHAILRRDWQQLYGPDVVQVLH